MLKLYVPTQLEQWVSEWYIDMKIYEPHQIDEITIAEKERILLMEAPCPSHAYVNNHIKVISVDSRYSRIDKREQFFHEMCHILRHDGSQVTTRTSIKNIQEFDARNFTKYALMPFHMLQKINFRDEHLIQTISQLFLVSFAFAELRLKQINNNILANFHLRNAEGYKEA